MTVNPDPSAINLIYGNARLPEMSREEAVNRWLEEYNRKTTSPSGASAIRLLGIVADSPQNKQNEQPYGVLISGAGYLLLIFTTADSPRIVCRPPKEGEIQSLKVTLVV